jgi:hypothetical protein
MIMNVNDGVSMRTILLFERRKIDTCLVYDRLTLYGAIQLINLTELFPLKNKDKFNETLH